MSEDHAEVQRIADRLSRERWTTEPGIAAVGVGRNSSGQLCLRVTVLDENNKNQIPTHYEKVAIEVSIAGAPEALS